MPQSPFKSIEVLRWVSEIGYLTVSGPISGQKALIVMASRSYLAYNLGFQYRVGPLARFGVK
jgi:hypothetical protein